jgi:polysaccharide export outer membrane protein
MNKAFIGCVSIFFGVIFFSSCVPNRKFTLLQKGDVNVKTLPTDTVVREHAYVNFDYKIQPQDILSIRFESLTPKEYDFFSGGNQAQQQAGMMQPGGVGALLIGELVDPDGNVPFPVIGKVKVAGLNIFEAQDKLQAMANQYLDSPIVKVRLINFRITILGEVRKEGSVVLGNNRVSMMEALALSGGLSDLADRQNIKLIRDINGKTQVQYINLLDEDFISSPNYYVHQNDILVVPALRQRPYRNYFGQNLALVVSTITLIVLTINLTR